MAKASYAADDVTSSVLYAPVKRMTENQATVCHNYRTNFSRNLRGWLVENSMQDTYDILDDSLQFNLLPPHEYIRLHTEDQVIEIFEIDLPYNEIGGRGPTLNSTVYMKYGKMSATIKASGTGGSVTAFILMGDGGDEIDFEFIGGDFNHVQTNYFWGNSKEYGVNGASHLVKGSNVNEGFHKYSIDWQPDKIDWFVDDEKIRTKTRQETCDTAGNCKFPSQPARIQFGLWDGSIEAGTAEWSHGPIDWSLPQKINAQIRDITVECHPDYNQIVN
ncbi:unnamed protein product [Rhizopus stolonifer]